jgi:hypothetical protein
VASLSPKEITAIVVGLALAALSPLSAWITGNSAEDAIKGQFEQQRRAQVADLQQRTYVGFLSAAEDSFLAPPDSEADRRLPAAEAAVVIVAGKEVREQASRLAGSALSGNEPDYRRARENIISAAQREYGEASR